MIGYRSIYYKEIVFYKVKLNLWASEQMIMEILLLFDFFKDKINSLREDSKS